MFPRPLGMKGPAFLDPLDVSSDRQDPEFSNFLQHCCPGSVSSIPTEGEGKWAWLGGETRRGQCGDLAALADVADGRDWDLLPCGHSKAGVGNLPLGAAAANPREKLREGVRSAVAPGWSGRQPDRDCALPQPLLRPPPSDRPGPARKSHWELCLDPATLSPVLKPFLCLSPPPPHLFLQCSACF